MGLEKELLGLPDIADKVKMARVGIFQAEWPLQSYTINSLRMFSGSGYLVDLFLYDVDLTLARDQLGNIENLHVHEFSASGNNLRQNVRNRFKTLLRSYWPGLYNPLLSLRKKSKIIKEQYLLLVNQKKDLIPKSVLQETFRFMKGKKYKVLIGIEKRGLVWAGKSADLFQVPFLYHSLELYTWDHHEYMMNFQSKRLKLAEQHYHKKSTATIVQDERRGEVLLKDNKIMSTDIIYSPISILGKTHKKKSTYLRDKFNIPKNNVVVLQFGWISEERLSLELAEIAQVFPENWKLIFHGYGCDDILKKIKKIDEKHRIILSLDLVPMQKLPELISSCDIGLVLYDKFSLNDRLTAFSSEKLALQLQSGVPIIAFDYPGYNILEKKGCGVLIKKVENIPDAVKKIFASYDEYRSNAFACFEQDYEFSANYRKVIDYVDKLH